MLSALVGMSRGVPPFRAWAEGRSRQAQELAAQLAEGQGGARMLAALHDSLRARRARLAAIDSTLPAESSPSAVAAALASALEDLADDHGVKLASLQLHADTILRAGRVRVSVRIGGVTDVTGLAGLLRSIDAGETPLAVRELSVAQPEPAAPDSRPEALHFDMLVVGLGRIGMPAAEARE
jgi:hypothetical protein